MKYKIFYHLKKTATNREIYGRTCSGSQFQKRLEEERSFVVETDDIKSIIESVKNDEDKKYNRYEEI